MLDFEVFTALLVLLFALALWIVKRTWVNRPLGLCEKPGCIRCSGNQMVQENAIEIFKNDEKFSMLNRLWNSLETSRRSSKFILYSDFLSSKEVWDLDDLPISYQLDIKHLIKNLPLIKNEFEKKRSFLHADKEKWSKIYFLNQGSRCEQNRIMYPETWRVLSNCSNLMRNCLFGYQFFSVLKPGSTINPHVGPTNVRLRGHLSIQIPNLLSSEYCHMNVNGQETSWESDCMIVFDDSFLHSVVYDADSSRSERVVLLLDFWHPDLTNDEKECLSECFSPLL